MCCARARATHISVSLWSLWAVVSSGSICVGNELPCARINTVRSLTYIRFRGTHFMARRGARTHARSEEIESISSLARAARTGVVCENMQGLGAKLRKLAGQAKICTPLAGEVTDCENTHCGLAHTVRVRPVGRPSFFVRGNMKRESLEPYIPGTLALRLHRSFDYLNNHSACDLSDCEFSVVR